MDYKKLHKDLLNKMGTAKIRSLNMAGENISEKELLKLAKKYNLIISDY